MNSSFWEDKSVLVTGHTGFKGGWLSLWLNAMGAKVVGYALSPSTEPSLYEIANVSDKLEASIIADIRSIEKLLDVVAKYRPKIVFHLAAQPLVRYSYNNPIETYSTNVMGTVNLLEAVRQVGGVRALVNVTSDKCYDNKEWLWGYRENEPMGGYDPYSSSKGCAELVTSAYRNSYFNSSSFSTHRTAVASVRSGNVVGGGDWAEDRLVCDIIRAFLAGRPAIIRNPAAIRPWQHVLEPLHGYMLLAQRLWEEGIPYAEAWNFGPSENDARTVEWVVGKMTQLWGEEASWEVDTYVHPHEAKFLKLDCAKARTKLGWRPFFSLSESLEYIVEWYKAFSNNEDMQAFTLGQIADYQTKCMSV